ncbi:MAG: glycoside hydrolase family 9 protein [Lachnospiraceae bacterium]|nr:glycoside hydrolase family 9 protein [Lachnospiraceae bacterium]
MIYVNQLGYQWNGVKHATVSGSRSYTLHKENGEAVLQGEAGPLSTDENSAEQVAVLDFSSVTEAGRYYFTDGDGQKSAVFPIGEQVYDGALRAALKMFYFQRCGMELEEKYAGRFAHKTCHTGQAYYLDAPEKKTELSGGWHDAGDYGRYITAAAVAVGHLLYAYALAPEAFLEETGIPESGSGLPDILNECRYELDWMLKMQDADGGVHHKATSMHFVDFVMPQEDVLEVVITPVSSLATADLAAAAALAARVYEPFDAAYAARLKEAAVRAGDWLAAHPDFLFHDPQEVGTGSYEDLCDADERLWAAAELYRLTKDAAYLAPLKQILELKLNLTALGWADVAGFAGMCILTAEEGCFDAMVTDKFRYRWLDEADRLLRVAEGNGFELAMHPSDFIWGSNMLVLCNAMVLELAHCLTGEQKYLQGARYQLDYIFGRNAMDTSYVTGQGERAFRDPHNRPGIADGIDEPIPGFVSGGPNRGACDTKANAELLQGVAPMKCYADHYLSYSTNEITIYWNSPLVFALAYLKKG